ncbi:hypothetical protein Neosp_010174 [[Neocosmospora] mangrovei]
MSTTYTISSHLSKILRGKPKGKKSFSSGTLSAPLLPSTTLPAPLQLSEASPFSARQRMLNLAANTREKGIDFAADLALQTNFYQDETGRTADPEVKLLVRCAVAASDPEAYAQTCEAVADPTHVDPEYGTIMGPTVLIAGDKDKISPVARSEGLRELLGGEAWVEVVKSGHQLILEDLDGVKHAIMTLMDRIG